MKTAIGRVAGMVGGLLLGLTAPVFGQTRESSTVESAVTVLDEIMAIRLREIPQSLLADAEGVAIVPNVLKISFVAGLRRGRGVLLLKDEAGAWAPPQFVTLTGGSVGWQAGVQATDAVLVFKTRRSVRGLTNGTLTLGADVAVAAGPLGRNAGAATDAGLKAEIYTYSRSRGLFAGVSLDGTVLEIDSLANAVYYQSPPAYYGGDSSPELRPLPPSAAKLIERLTTYSSSARPVDSVPPGQFPQPVVTLPDASVIRQQLAGRSQELYAVLDDGWKAYLALPAGVFAGNAPPDLAALSRSLSRFDAVAAEPRYRALAQRQDFQATHRLLREYVSTLTPRVSSRLQLPPPPSESLPGRR